MAVAVSIALHSDCYIAVCGYGLRHKARRTPTALDSRQSLACGQYMLCTAQIGQASFCTSLQHHTAAMQLQELWSLSKGSVGSLVSSKAATAALSARLLG